LEGDFHKAGRRRPLWLVWPTGARKLDPPDRPRRVERPLEPHKRWHLVRDDPGVVVRRHAPEHRGEKIEPGPEMGLEHIVDRGLRKLADQHLVLA